MRTPIAAALVFLSLIGSAQAGTITAVGAVKALTNINQVLGTVGTANFDEGPTSGQVPLTLYSAQGLTWEWPPVVDPSRRHYTGSATYGPIYSLPPSPTNRFPLPIGGGGTQIGQILDHPGGVATFSVTITQVGLTASSNGAQFLTVWSKSGAMIGQVNWVPASDASFIGIDTLGVPIGMVSYGNDNLWAGEVYETSGSTIYSDTWVWATGKCTTNAQCDDQNVCTTDTCTVATGACVHANNTASCSDGNSCTQNDVCSAGACVPGAAVTCTAVDTCHTAGVCNTSTGVCSTPAKADGSACSDANACTQADTCISGVCTGQNPVVCPAPDACHTAGTCNPMTGVCSNPNKADGTACSDANACTQTDTCQAGVCTGQSPVICPAPDACHTAGTCNMATGMCSNPAKPNGAACTDSNACTQSDTCQAGVCTGQNPVVCTASDACHTAGLCNTMTGVCSNPAKADGTACNDSNACTATDTCQAGTCTGQNPVVCPAPDPCHDIGLCNTTTGVCSNPAKPNGSSCDDGNGCTQTDTCQAGACTGQNPVVCTPANDCEIPGVCDPTVGTCTNTAKPDGTTCDDGTACTQGDVCQAGACLSGVVVTCTALDACHDVGICNATTGICSNPAKAEAPPATTAPPALKATPASPAPAPRARLSSARRSTSAMRSAPAIPQQVSAPTPQGHRLLCQDRVRKQNGSCDPSTGLCVNAAKPDGIPCGNGICIAGTCSDEAGNTTSVTSSTGSDSTSTTGSASTSASTGVGGSGAGGAGGAGTGGASGGTGVGGSSATGISSPSATSTTSGGDGTLTPAGGCGCSTPGTSPARAPWLLLGLLLPALRRRRKASRFAA